MRKIHQPPKNANNQKKALWTAPVVRRLVQLITTFSQTNNVTTPRTSPALGWYSSRFKRFSSSCCKVLSRWFIVSLLNMGIRVQQWVWHILTQIFCRWSPCVLLLFTFFGVLIKEFRVSFFFFSPFLFLLLSFFSFFSSFFFFFNTEFEPTYPCTRVLSYANHIQYICIFFFCVCLIGLT